MGFASIVIVKRTLYTPNEPAETAELDDASKQNFPYVNTWNLPLLVGLIGPTKSSTFCFILSTFWPGLPFNSSCLTLPETSSQASMASTWYDTTDIGGY